MLVSLIAGLALASPPAEVVLGWDTVGFVAARDDAAAFGPDLLVGGPAGLAAMWDPAAQRIVVLRDLVIVGDLSFGPVDDLAFTPSGDLLVLTGRTLSRLGRRGDVEATFTVPGIVPTGVAIVVEGGTVVLAEPFGNRHRACGLSATGLVAASGPSLEKNPHPVTWDGSSLRVDQAVVPVPNALRAGGRYLAANGHHWLVVSEVTGDHPLVVARRAVDVDRGSVDVLPVSGRLYAPARDVAIDGDGRLLWLDPQVDGLHVLRVTP